MNADQEAERNQDHDAADEPSAPPVPPSLALCLDVRNWGQDRHGSNARERPRPLDGSIEQIAQPGQAKSGAERGHKAAKHDARTIGADRSLREVGFLAQRKALRLPVSFELHRDLGLHLLRLDLAVARLGVVIVARQITVLALDLGDLKQPRVVVALLRTKILLQ